ncbi:carboxyl-terminal processing protease CtpB [Cylindrospermopsis curvispora]|uniref:S41 family peptidase n=1 Tax=Cylindrospermopsis curvispora GIHE-G1 TaxID=2666332 RepID=A0A7H0F4R1_9CYAN|nr:carboxyl-terminal processing protease CtpB [Cylindrospermopsis curvispora]QNP31027.1 S41 family peptidase [Cylindrospermopsis curvispora GIHE-G1]
MNQSAKPYSPLRVALVGTMVATSATLYLFGQAWTKQVKAALQDSPKALVDQVWQLVNREYVDGKFNQQNWQAIRQGLLSKNYTSKQEAYVAIRSALQRLGDPYTRFMDPKQFETLTSQTAGEVTGIGIRMEINDQTKRLTVVEPIQNSPADKAGIKAGDEIIAINGQSTSKMKIDEASGLIRGQAGTAITLKISRPGNNLFDIKLTRATIEVPIVRYTLKRDNGRRIGYIRLQEFSSHAAEQMDKAIRDLNNQKVEFYVLDLRGNPGGLLQASVEIARMWLNQGGIVKTVDRVGGSEETKANGTALTNRPLAILVDGNSASASEILTGALKDNNRAVVVGSQTYGKALVQSVHELIDGSGLAITIAHYYTPKGTDINKKGITPDIQLDLTQAQERELAANPNLLGTLSDPQYARAVSAILDSKFARPPQPSETF